MPAQYLFRGRRRSTGEPVAGRVTAPREDVVCSVLDHHGIIVESLSPEAVTPDNGVPTARGPLLCEELDDALSEIGLRIRFDQMPRRHEGHCVWILDHEKIRSRVMKLVNEVIGTGEAGRHARRRIERVLDDLFDNGSGVETEQSSKTEALGAEISRLRAEMAKIERGMASMSVRAWREQHEPRGRISPRRMTHARTRDDVLLEIFEHNLELMETLKSA